VSELSFTLQGVGISGGIAIGPAHLISHTSLEVAHYSVQKNRVAPEIARFDAAVGTVREELELLQVNVPATAPPEFAAFLDLHLMILNDATLSQTPRALIEQQQCNAEWALKQQMDSLLEQFEEIEDSYLRERREDVVQVVERVLKALLGQPKTVVGPTRGEGAILVAHDLSPADVIVFKQHQFGAFVTDLGGATSHTAILARSLNIPSIVALHHAWKMVRENELLIVDGNQGVLIVNPDKTALTEYRLRQEQLEIERQKLRRLKTTPATTLDGAGVELFANIELPGDMEQVKQSGATGVGLFRTEFLFMSRPDLPHEDEQFEAYRSVAEAMRGQPVVIRTLDIGADKNLHEQQQVATNPALGLRAIRYCLAEPRLFNTQLRAILRASHYGRIGLLLPMLSSRPELDQSLAMLAAAKAQLVEERIPFDAHLRVGGMIEIPAAALTLQSFIRKLDFLSIGTNDLIQYTLAIDRSDESVAHLYNPLHPAVLQLIAQTIRTADKAQTPVAICGEMAGEVRLTRLLLGFGLRQFSMHPAQLPAVKQVVLKTSLDDIRALTRRILQSEDPDKIQGLLTRLNA
jgi:phosphoenolpyruvate-protein phosphotransferase (PTS system enzyme I)